MNVNKVFEFCAAYSWPVARNFVHLSRRCKSCILSEKCSPLVDGRCEECRRTAPISRLDPDSQWRERLDKTIRSAISGDGYHALLLLSGGKDSVYLLHRLREQYPNLKMLCALVDNGFMSPTAIPGAKSAAEKLKADLLIVNSHRDEFALSLRKAFLSLGGRGSYDVVDRADGDLILKVGKEAALRMDIPLVIVGLSWVQVQRILGIDDIELVEDGGPRVLFPLAAWKVDEQEIRSAVRSLGLLPKGGDSPIQSNNSLVLPMAVADVLNNGYCSFEPEFAQLVREGKTDRKVWLHVFELLEFAVRRGLLDKEANRSLAGLGLSLADVVREGK